MVNTEFYFVGHWPKPLAFSKSTLHLFQIAGLVLTEEESKFATCIFNVHCCRVIVTKFICFRDINFTDVVVFFVE